MGKELIVVKDLDAYRERQSAVDNLAVVKGSVTETVSSGGGKAAWADDEVQQKPKVSGKVWSNSELGSWILSNCLSQI